MDALRGLLVAEDEERRAIERQMHDGVQQQLVAVAVNLQIARGLVESDPHGAGALLDDVRAVVAEALDELRGLAQRIHPSLLDTQGLIAALRTAAATAPIPTRVDGIIGEPMSLDAATTIYRCCVATLAAAQGEKARATIAVQTRDGVRRIRDLTDRCQRRCRHARSARPRASRYWAGRSKALRTASQGACPSPHEPPSARYRMTAFTRLWIEVSQPSPSLRKIE